MDLIDVGTRGRSGISRWVFGGVVDRVSGFFQGPVMVIKLNLVYSLIFSDNE